MMAAEENTNNEHDAEEEYYNENNDGNNEDHDQGVYKIHISRIPTKFNEEIVERILKESLLKQQSEESNEEEEQYEVEVELIYPRDEEEGDESNQNSNDPTTEEHGNDNDNPNGAKKDKDPTKTKEHRGFGFAIFQGKNANRIHERSLELQTLKGGRKATSTKKYAMYIRPCVSRQDLKNNKVDTTVVDPNQCYLWSQHRCPYGDHCKFNHTGPGSCKILPTASDDQRKKKKGRCFAFKKGKCKKGDDCPFSHDFVPTVQVVAPSEDGGAENKTSDENKKKDIPDSEKDCINWKTKGRCRKRDTCPYKHDPEKCNLKKKRKQEKLSKENAQQQLKEKQPLSVRVFGMNYETTEEDIRQFFDGCGKIHNVEFPLFEDSGRSKGYCCIHFSSPKAVTKAIELNGQELMGRWLSIQAGKMLVQKWEQYHQHQQHDSTSSTFDNNENSYSKRQRIS